MFGEKEKVSFLPFKFNYNFPWQISTFKFACSSPISSYTRTKVCFKKIEPGLVSKKFQQLLLWWQQAVPDSFFPIQTEMSLIKTKTFSSLLKQQFSLSLVLIWDLYLCRLRERLWVVLSEKCWKLWCWKLKGKTILNEKCLTGVLSILEKRKPLKKTFKCFKDSKIFATLLNIFFKARKFPSVK